MITILICFVAYLILSGSVQPFLLRREIEHCSLKEHAVCNDYGNRIGIESCEKHHRGDSLWGALFGPVVLPFTAGAKIGSALDPVTRAANKRKREEEQVKHEIKQAEHKQQLAAIEAKTTRILEQALKD